MVRKLSSFTLGQHNPAWQLPKLQDKFYLLRLIRRTLKNPFLQTSFCVISEFVRRLNGFIEAFEKRISSPWQLEATGRFHNFTSLLKLSASNQANSPQLVELA